MPDTPGVRWVVCQNTAEAAKDAATRDSAVTHLTSELDRIADASNRAQQAFVKARSAGARQRLEAELAGHTRAECGLRDHVTRGRWLRQTSTGRLVLDNAAIAAERNWTASICCPPPTSTCPQPRSP